MHTQLIRASYYLLYLQKFKGYMKQNAGHIELYTGNNYFVGKIYSWERISFRMNNIYFVKSQTYVL